MEDRLPDGVTRVRADNPSPLTLDGTNTYVVAGWVVDPGPDDERHLDAVTAAAGERVAGIVLTHDHVDHSEGAPALARRTGADAILPGHGPVVWDPRAKLDEYIEHRLDRERSVLAALATGERTRDELLE